MTDGRIKFKVESLKWKVNKLKVESSLPPPEGLRQRYLAVRHTDTFHFQL